jgi:6-phosphofructokinase 2
MPSIVTITFSPCIDKSVSVPLLVPDKKLHCTIDQLQPGGGGINVARVIQRLGLPVTAIYPAGGSSGALLHSLLAKEAVTAITKISYSQKLLHTNNSGWGCLARL